MTSLHDHHPRHRPWKRLALAVVVVTLAIAAAGAVPVKTGEAAVITRFGAPVRVVTQPGLSWILPPPIERAQIVDRRLRTTATGSHGVLTKDGLSLVVQAYAAWRVGGDGATVLRYVRATGSDGDMAANQLRTLLNSSLETVSGRFVLADLVNTDPTAMRKDKPFLLDAMEDDDLAVRQAAKSALEEVSGAKIDVDVAKKNDAMIDALDGLRAKLMPPPPKPEDPAEGRLQLRVVD